jgi:hypothetical protein
MTAIKWNSGTSTWDTVDNPDTDTSWYNYANKEWANAKTNDGSMWVWIPRYIYKISTGWHTSTAGTIDVQFSKVIDDNWNSSGIGNIDTGTTSNASNNKWTNHPAFDFGSTHLTGIWVAKFEATASEGVANGYTSDGTCPIAGDNVTTKTVKILPNVQSWRCISIGNMFTNTRNMETNGVYGWGTTGVGIDTHMMKNSEWGAVTYLSKSTYGQNGNEIWINNSQTYTTGCAGSSVSASAYDGCQYSYETANGVQASTTGNIYGIYDLSGGTWEELSAYLDNGHINLNNGLSIINADSKYKDVYAKGATDDSSSNYALAISHKGDAIYETSNSDGISNSWFGDYAIMSDNSWTWFSRGGSFNHSSSGGTYNFAASIGDVGGAIGFRPVLTLDTGL